MLKVTGRGSKAQGFDPLTGAELGPVPSRSTSAVKVNNALRRAVRAALATLTLRHPDPVRRLAAANGAFLAADPEYVPALDAALAAEEDPGVAKALAEARAAAVLAGDGPLPERLAAVETVAGRGGNDALRALSPLRNADEPEIAAAARSGGRRHRAHPGDLGAGAERLVRAVARLGAAAGRGRARHHLRGDGRHQHGARRADHARRLHHLPHPGGDPRLRARALRLVALLSRCRSRSWWPAASGSPSSAASCATSTAGRSRRCSPPGASA